MTGIPRQLGRIMRSYDPEPMEMTSSVMLMAIGLVLISPADTFTTSPGYALLARLLPEWVWGAILVHIGIWRLVAIARGRRNERFIGAFTAFVTFLFFAIAIGSQNPFGFGLATFATMSMGSFWVCFRISGMRS